MLVTVAGDTDACGCPVFVAPAPVEAQPPTRGVCHLRAGAHESVRRRSGDDLDIWTLEIRD